MMTTVSFWGDSCVCVYVCTRMGCIFMCMCVCVRLCEYDVAHSRVINPPFSILGK